MSGGDLPEQVRSFIAQHIRTVVELESLLLLHREPQREWNAADLGKELRIDEQFARQEITDLVQRGLAECSSDNSTCRYAPRTAELDRAVKELARIYEERRVSVIQAIYSKPADPIQSFADAFKFRKGDPHG